jgi:hypothetical protein
MLFVRKRRQDGYKVLVIEREIVQAVSQGQRIKRNKKSLWGGLPQGAVRYPLQPHPQRSAYQLAQEMLGKSSITLIYVPFDLSAKRAVGQRSTGEAFNGDFVTVVLQRVEDTYK